MEFFNSLGDFWQFEFLSLAFIGSFMLSLSSGLLSPVIVSKKFAFMGAAVSHSTILSLALSYYLLGPALNIVHFIFTLIITLFMIIWVAKGSSQSLIPADSFIGIFYSTTMALGIVVFSLTGRDQGELFSYLFGDILLLEATDLMLMLTVTFALFLSIFIPYNQWVYFLWDEQGATIAGIKTKLYHYTTFLLVTLLIITGVKLAGTVLVNSLLIIPGVFAFKSGKNMKQVFVHSMIFSVLTCISGLIIANWKDLPPGPSMAITQFLVLIILLPLLAKKH